MSAAERLEAVRRELPVTAGALVGLVVDNPAQFAAVASGSYVITRAMFRVVRPYGIAGALLTAAASYGLSVFLIGEARRRGLLEFRVRGPGGELLTLAELAALEPDCGCGGAATAG